MSLIFFLFLSLQLHLSPPPPPPPPPPPATSTPRPHHVLSILTSFADSFNPQIVQNSTPIPSLVTTSRPVSDLFSPIISKPLTIFFLRLTPPSLVGFHTKP
ncbi:hypothetical protein CsSME_00039621 [Camellia sinensis var. sinensis]